MGLSRRSGNDFRNEFSWSHSRFETFRGCLKRYHYHYYAYWGGWDPSADPLVRRIYILRNLKNRYLWAGSAVHDAVAAVLEDVRAGRAPSDPQRVAEGAVERMRRGFRESRDGAYLQQPKGKLGLMEHHYREAVPDDEWRSFADMVRRCILTFFREPFLAQAQGLEADDWLALEDLESFSIDNAKVYVKMDLAHRSPAGGAVILDWKTGRRKPKPEGLQLGCYALYATEAWGIEAKRIEVREVNLNTGAVGSAQITERHLKAAREQICEGIAAMRERLVDPENNVADPQDFPASPDPRTCRRCAFRDVCPEYRAALAPAEGASLWSAIS
ncbi:MAG: PD-(D/E)XK nuclease family protein [Candidatus Eisenbacteria sp.]|nr:PD-(D/E)XK nuclease family protein [Candidatus Eisenbacteria bacterium]